MQAKWRCIGSEGLGRPIDSIFNIKSSGWGDTAQQKCFHLFGKKNMRLYKIKRDEKGICFLIQRTRSS